MRFNKILLMLVILLLLMTVSSLTAFAEGEVTLSFTDGKGTELFTVSGQANDVIILPKGEDYAPLGSDFLCWKIGESTFGSQDEYTLSENATLTAVYTLNYSGTGSVDDPFAVYTAKGLSTLFKEGNEDKHFVLEADIDLSGVENFSSFPSAFIGSFDGKGHSISNLKMTSADTLGFIPKMQNATVKNLIMENAVVSLDTEADRFSAGIISGQATSCVLENLRLSGSVSYAKGTAGGVCGKIGGDSLLSLVISEVDVNAHMAGGIGGEIAQGSSLLHCANLGNITARSCVGGIAGKSSGELRSVANYGDIICSSDFGVVAGIVGLAGENCSIEKAYNGKTPTLVEGGVGEMGVIFVAQDFACQTKDVYCLEGVGEESDTLKVLSQIQSKTLLLSLIDDSGSWGVSNKINQGYPVPKCLYTEGDITLSEEIADGRVEKVYDGTPKGIELESLRCDSFIFYYEGKLFDGRDFPLCDEMPTEGGYYTVYAVSDTAGVLGFFSQELKIKKAILAESGYYMTDVSKVYTSLPQGIVILDKNGIEPNWMEITGSMPFYTYETKREGEWVSISAQESVNVGTYRVTATIDGGNNYENIEDSDLNALLTIIPAPLYAKADDKVVVFGEALPDFGVSVIGFLGEDGPHNCKGYVAPTAFYFTEGVENPLYAGVYEGAIKIKERGSAQNYSFFSPSAEGEYVCIDGEYLPYDEALHVEEERYSYNGENGTLTIAPAVISGAIFDIPTFVYDGLPHGGEISGELPPQATVVYSYKTDGVYGEESEAPPTFVDAGSYFIKATVKAINYQDLEIERELVIEKGELDHLVFASASYVFDGEDKKVSLIGELPEGTEVVYTVNGGEEVSEITLLRAGEYFCVATAKESANYRELVLSCKIEIERLRIIIVAENCQSVYGQPLSEDFALSVYGDKGLIPSDDKSLLGLDPTCLCESEMRAGDYVITPIVASEENHEVEIKTGVYTVAKKELILSLDPHALPYGEEIPLLEILYDGFVLEDTADALENKPVASVDAEKGSDVGDYPIFLTLPEDDNYVLKYPYVCYLTIKKAYLKPEGFGDKTTVYNGEAQSILLSDLPKNTAVLYNYYQNGVLLGSFDSLGNLEGLEAKGVFNAGVYSVEAIISGSKNFYEFKANAILTVSKAKAVILAGSVDITYGDSFIAPDFTVESLIPWEKVVSDLSVSLSCDYTEESQSAVGSYPITVNFVPNPNYDASCINGVYKVGKAVLIARLSIESAVFGQAYPTPQISYQGFVFEDDESVLTTAPRVLGMPSLFADAGKYPLSLEGGESDNYTFQYVGATFAVLRADYSYMYTLKSQTAEYDGSLKSLALSWADESRSDDVSFPVGIEPVYRGNGQIDKGVYTITATLGGNENHVLTTYTATLTILPKQVWVEGVSAQNKSYDGKTSVLLYGGNLMGVLDADMAKVGFTLGEGNTENKKAEEDKAVFTNLLLTGEKAHNYLLTQPDYIRVSISKIPLEILGIKAVDRRYNQWAVVDLSLDDVSFVGITEGDSIALDATSYGLLTDMTVGERAVTVDGETLRFVGEDYLNYTLQPISYVTVNITTGSLFTATDNIFMGANGVLEIINPDFIANAVYTENGIVMNSLQFDGSVHVCNIFLNIPDNVSIAVSGVGAEASPLGFKVRNAGEYLLTLDINGNGFYYSESLPVTFKILPKEITITDVKAVNRPYDGTASVQLEGGALQGVMGDDISFDLGVALAASKNVGKGIALTTFIVLGGALASNYVLIQPEVSCEILPKTLTIQGVMPITRPYDGTADIALEGGSLVGVVEGESLGFELGIAIAQSPNVGENIPLTTAITLKGEGVENYALVQPLLVATVTKKTVVVKGDSFTIYSNQPLPEFTYTVSGFFGDDGVVGSLALDVEEIKMNNTYTIGIGSLVCGDNYEIQYLPGVLVVNIPIYVWVLVALAVLVIVGVAVVLVVLKKKKAPKPINDGTRVDSISIGEKGEKGEEE